MSSEQETRPEPETGSAPDLDAVIVGAGFSGMFMLYRLRDVLGMKARVFEAGDGVGGTWEWTTRYPQQPEILRYLEHVADRFELRRDIQFNTRVAAATFNEANNYWEVRTAHGERFTARYLISAVGCLSAANIPDFKGLEDFKGDWYHTGAWPHDGVDFSGKRVGQIGTGSTGIQAVPVIAARAEHLTVFQRTPNYSIPALDAPYTEEDGSETPTPGISAPTSPARRGSSCRTPAA